MNPQAKLLENAREKLISEQFSQAEYLYRQYLEIHPPHAEAYFNLGLALHRQGHLAEATSFYQQTIKTLPSLMDAHQNLGHALHTLAQLDEAAASYQRAIKLKPKHAELHNNLGNVFKDMGQLGKAVACYEQALELDPQHAKAYNNLGNAFKDLGMLDEAVASYQKALELAPQQIESLSNLLFVLSYHPACPPDQYLSIAEEFGKRVAALATPYTQWTATDAPQTMRVGLVSGDMRSHPVGFFLENLVRHINPEKLALVAYATKPQDDELTARIKPYFTEWHSLAGLSDQAAAQKIHDDGIHILIDLAGHTAHNRLPIFAWKPAPVQVTWLGYFASTGVEQMDVLLADTVSVPESHQHHFTETIVTLPDTRLCFTPPAESLTTSPPPVLKNGHITFGCFQNLSKLDGQVLNAWAHILQALPNAKLRLQNHQIKSYEVAELLMERLIEHGIAPEQVILVEPESREAYLQAHAEIDIILDTFPYPGGTTTCEALWMGVPTLTLAGNTLLARQGASLLACAGLHHWIAADVNEYVSKAVFHASNIHQLAQLRGELSSKVLVSPLFDGVKFARNFEVALRDIWEQKTAPPLV